MEELNMNEFNRNKALIQIKAGCRVLVPRLTDEDIRKYKREATSVSSIRPLKFRKLEDNIYWLVTESDSDSENEIQHIPTPQHIPKSIRTISLISDDEEDLVNTDSSNVRVANANGSSSSAIVEEKIQEKSEYDDPMNPCEILPESHSIQSESRTVNNVNSENDSIVASISPCEIVPESHSVQNESRTANNVNSKNDAPTTQEKSENNDSLVASVSPCKILPKSHSIQSKSRTANDVNSENDAPTVECETAEIQIAAPSTAAAQPEQSSPKTVHDHDYQFISVLPSNILGIVNRSNCELATKLNNLGNTVSVIKLNKDLVSKHSRESEVKSKLTDSIPMNDGKSIETQIEKPAPVSVKVLESNLPKDSSNCIIPGIKHTFPNDTIVIKRVPPTLKITPSQTTSTTVQIVGDVRIMKNTNEPATKVQIKRENSSQNVSSDATSNNTNISMPSLSPPPSTDDRRVPCSKSTENLSRPILIDNRSSIANPSIEIPPSSATVMQHKIRVKGLDKLGVPSEHNENYLLRDAPPKITISENVDHKLGVRSEHNENYLLRDAPPKITISENVDHSLLQKMTRAVYPFKQEVELLSTRLKMILEDRLAHETKQRSLSRSKLNIELQIACESHESTERDNMMKLVPLIESCLQGGISADIFIRKLHEAFAEKSKTVKPKQKLMKKSPLIWLTEMLRDLLYRGTFPVDNILQQLPWEKLHRIVTSINPSENSALSSQLNAINSLPVLSNTTARKKSMVEQCETCTPTASTNRLQNYPSRYVASPRTTTQNTNPVENLTPPRRSESPMYAQRMNPQPARHLEFLITNPQSMYPLLSRRLESSTTNPPMMNSQPLSSHLNHCYVSNPVPTPVCNDQIRNSHFVNPLSTPIRRDSIPSPHYANATRCNNSPASLESSSLQNQVVRGASNTFSEPLAPLDQMFLNYGVDGRFGQNSMNTAFHSQSVHPHRMPIIRQNHPGTVHHQAQYQPRMEPPLSSNQLHPLQGITSADRKAIWKKTVESCGVGPTPAPMQNTINPYQNHQNMFNINRRSMMFQNNPHERNTTQWISYPNTIPSNQMFQSYQQSNPMLAHNNVLATSRNTPPVAVHQTTTIVQQRIFEQTPRQPPPPYNSQVNSTRFIQPTNEMPSHRSSQSVNFKPPSIPELRVDDSVQEQVVNSSISPSEGPSPINPLSRSTPIRPPEISQSASGLQIHRVESSSSPNFNLVQDPEGGMNNINDLFNKETDTNELEECIRGLLNENTSS